MILFFLKYRPLLLNLEYIIDTSELMRFVSKLWLAAPLGYQICFKVDTPAHRLSIPSVYHPRNYRTYSDKIIYWCKYQTLSIEFNFGVFSFTCEARTRVRGTKFVL
jgi:hypothetical protein